MARKQGHSVMTPVGWRDSRPNLTTGEHDTLVAMIELAWHDVQINPDTVPESRREEALAAKISAWEWFTKDPEEYLEDGENPPRIGFRAACLHLGLNTDRVRWSCLHKSCKIPHDIMAVPITEPGTPMPDAWREQFIGPDDPERHREDRIYVKRKDKSEQPKEPHRKTTKDVVPEPAATAVQKPAAKPATTSVVPIVACVVERKPTPPAPTPLAPKIPAPTMIIRTSPPEATKPVDYAPALDDPLQRLPFGQLAKVWNNQPPPPSRPTAKQSAMPSEWERAAFEGHEEAD